MIKNNAVVGMNPLIFKFFITSLLHVNFTIDEISHVLLYKWKIAYDKIK